MYSVFLKITKPVWLNTYIECTHESENDSESESEKDSMHIRRKISILTFDGTQPACLCHFLQYAVYRRILRELSPTIDCASKNIHIYTHIPVIGRILWYIPGGWKKYYPNELASEGNIFFFHPRGIFYKLGNNWFIIWVWDVIKRRIYRVQNNFIDQLSKNCRQRAILFVRRAIYALNIV